MFAVVVVTSFHDTQDLFRVDIGHCFTFYGVWKLHGKHTAYMELGGGGLDRIKVAK